jgi:hypothetical protein
LATSTGIGEGVGSGSSDAIGLDDEEAEDEGLGEAEIVSDDFAEEEAELPGAGLLPQATRLNNSTVVPMRKNDCFMMLVPPFAFITLARLYHNSPFFRHMTSFLILMEHVLGSLGHNKANKEVAK